MKLLDYWPSLDHLNECVRPEAENPAEAVFMAVHQSMQLKRRAYGQVDDVKDCTEADLLKAFLDPRPPRGTLLLPIEGDSGSGKSHMVRWLSIQLRRDNDRGSRHVIRIPKSSSLKRVLFLIMERLEGQKYDYIRDQLAKARDQLDDIQAAERVRAGLLTEIRTRARHAKERIQQAAQRGGIPNPKDKLWAGHGDDRYLPALLSDPETSKLFMNRGGQGIIDLIVQRLTQEVSSTEPIRQQFDLTDFDVPADLDISKAGEWARRYLQSLSANDHARGREALDLLNEVFDAAIAPIATPSDANLTDLFVDIRRQLLLDGRELVLLVEDFAALKGVEGALLDAMNREGIRDGKQELCVMRTALAVTRGYVSNRETVATRAIYGWEIEDIPYHDNQRAIDAIVRLIGAYMNAARFGQKRLEQLFASRDPTIPEWRPYFGGADVLEPDEETALTAFGESERGIPLFPFNRAMIEQLASKNFQQDGHIRLNPRDVINHVVRKVIGDYRLSFEQGVFPPEDFMNCHPNEVDASVSLRIGDQRSAPGLAKRCFVLVRFWGNNPDHFETLDLPRGVYRAFALEPLDVSNGGAGHPGPSTISTQTPPLTSEQPRIPNGSDPPTLSPAPGQQTPSLPIDTPEEKEAKEWSTMFDDWTLGTPIPQTRANKLREWLTEDVLQYVNWDSELLKPLTVSHTLVLIPRAKGTGAITEDTAFVVLCSEADLDDKGGAASIVIALRGLVRFHLYKSWNFPDAERAFPHYANLIERLAQHAIGYLRRSYDRFDGDAVPLMTQGLMFGARALNIDGAFAQDHQLQLAALFTVPDTTPPPAGTAKWDECRRQCYQYRTQVRDALLRQVAARQGGYPTVYAIDAARLLAEVRSFTKEGRVTATCDDRKCDQDVKVVAQHLTELRRKGDAAIKERQEVLGTWSRAFRQWLGDDVDKSTLISVLTETVNAAANIVLHPSTRERLLALIEGFRGAAIGECLEHCAKLEGEASPATVMSAVAKVSDEVIQICNSLRNEFDGFLQAATQKLRGDLVVMGEDSSEKSVAYVDGMLTELAADIEHFLQPPQSD